MSKYIDRDALLAELQEEIDFETSMYTEEQNKYFTMGLKCALRDVKSQPEADVAEVRHGEWHYPPYAPFGGSYEMKRCSICGYKPDFDADNPYSNFCPNCGAKMDGQRRTSNDS